MQRRRLAELVNLASALELRGDFIGRVEVSNENNESLNDEHSTETASTLTDYTTTTETAADDLIDGEADINAPVISHIEGEAEQAPEVNSADRIFYTRMRTQAVQSREKLKIAMKTLSTFRQQFPLELMERERDRQQTEFLENLSKLRTGELRLQVLSKSLASVDAQLSSTQQFITMNTGVPDVAIADALSGSRKQDLASLSQVAFHRQELNPVWISLQDQRIKISSELETTRNEVDEIGNVIRDKENQLKRIQKVLYDARINEDLVKQNLDRWQDSNRELFESYVDTNNQIFSTARQLALLEQDVQELSNQTSETRELVGKYQQLYDAGYAEQQRLEAQLRAIEHNSDLLLQKLQEAQVAVGSDVSDVSLAARAVTPAKHYFPPRTILLIAFTFLTAALLLGFLARRRYMELNLA
jgi:hypothetical protein